MARNDYRQFIGSAGPGYRSDRARLTDAMRYLAIAAGFACRDLAQGLPDPLLESGTTNIQRQIHRLLRVVQMGNHLRHAFGKRVITRL